MRSFEYASRWWYGFGVFQRRQSSRDTIIAMDLSDAGEVLRDAKRLIARLTCWSATRRRRRAKRRRMRAIVRRSR